VDTVLYFEGEMRNQYKILRAVKNRFGSTNEIGLFEMTNLGLMQVDNPNSVFYTWKRFQYLQFVFANYPCPNACTICLCIHELRHPIYHSLFLYLEHFWVVTLIWLL